MFKPTSFPGQQPDEKLIFFLRRHWLSFVPVLSICLFLFAIPIIAFLVLTYSKVLSGEFRNLLILASSVFALTIMAFSLTVFIDYYLDIWIVTNERVIDIEQHGLFNRVVSEQSLIRIQDVTAKRRGIFQTIFDFGDVFIQTAGEAPNFIFHSIPKPNETARKILQLYHDGMRRNHLKQGKGITGEELRRGGAVEL